VTAFGLFLPEEMTFMVPAPVVREHVDVRDFRDTRLSVQDSGNGKSVKPFWLPENPAKNVKQWQDGRLSSPNPPEPLAEGGDTFSL
jgi:hypothetical protein